MRKRGRLYELRHGLPRLLDLERLFFLFLRTDSCFADSCFAANGIKSIINHSLAVLVLDPRSNSLVLGLERHVRVELPVAGFTVAEFAHGHSQVRRHLSR